MVYGLRVTSEALSEGPLHQRRLVGSELPVHTAAGIKDFGSKEARVEASLPGGSGCWAVV